MSLYGKISNEIGVHATASKWFNLYANQLHHVQNLAESIHEAKLHQGDDWHHNESVKHWTYTIDGKVTTCHEIIESIDEQNKRITYRLYGEDIDHKYKVFKLIFQATDKNDGGAIVNWTVEYEMISDDVEPPYGYIEFVHKCTKDVDKHLVKA